MTPYYSDDLVTIYHGDCRDYLPHLRADAVITDPPYGIGKDYGAEYEDRGGDPYWSFMREVVNLCRAAAPTVLMTHRVLALRELTGWDWVAAWVKRNQQMRLFSMPVLPTWEPILCWGIKGLEATHRPDTFTVDAIPSTAITGGHPFPKPKSLMAQLIRWTDGKTVLDPFLGSGTTLFAAKDLGVRAIGIEIEERYCEVAANRCRQEVLGLSA